jgi:hypothetical protein
VFATATGYIVVDPATEEILEVDVYTENGLIPLKNSDGALTRILLNSVYPGVIMLV